jgi:predicted acetyltransferase
MHEDGFGLHESDEVESAEGFAAWVRRLLDSARLATATATATDADRTGCTFRWIVEGERVLGGIALRHGPDDYVRRLGHIGYGVRPSARRRGVAAWALASILDEARDLGMDRVLLVCEEDNAASARTIERLGGVLESFEETEFGRARRYWINLG